MSLRAPAAHVPPALSARRASRPAGRVARSSPASSAEHLPLSPPQWQPTGEDVHGALMDELSEFLRSDLVHLFDEQGIDASRYSERVEFTDPLTRYTSLKGYLFNIAFLRRAFSPVFTLHSVTRTGELQLTTRWTMEMRVSAGPLAALWAPRLVFTGTSELSVSPEGLFTQHVDYWDSVDDNRYLSLEAVGDLFAQLASLQRTPELESPAYTPLLRRRQYEVRRYAACAEIVRALPPGTGPAGDGGGFNSLAGYIFGGNASGERLEMTTPVLNRVAADGAAQMAFPVFSDAPLPEPRAGSGVQRGEAPARVAAARGFSGVASDAQAAAEAAALRAALLRDGLSPREGYALARYNDPFTPPWARRNEVLIDLEDEFAWE